MKALGIAISLALVGHSALGQTASTSRPYVEPAFPWEWAVKPVPGHMQSWSSNGVLAFLDSHSVDGLQVVLGVPRGEGPLTPIYRPVVLDGDLTRFALVAGDAIGTTGFTMSRYHLAADILPSKSIAWVGVERLTAEGRKTLSVRAQGAARAQGVQVLPFPSPDEPYVFTLQSVDGATISSSDLQGKVVLIDCWATWCTPCMQKMPALVGLESEMSAQGLVVIGVNFDQDWDKAARAITKNEITWPNVSVPDDKAVRELWHEAATVQALPRLFILDRGGILRGDVGPHELEAAIRQLM